MKLQLELLCPPHTSCQEQELDGVVAECGVPVRAQDIGMGGQLQLGEAGYSPRRASSTSSWMPLIQAPSRAA